jgi:NTP pyrophosphatase (non-canonical NTP hydrolase)
MTKAYKTPCERPEGLDWELLLILMEECDEVSQRSSKAQRFGAREVQSGQDLDNVQRLSMEIGDLLHVVDLLRERGLVEDEWVEEGKRHKAKQLAKYLQNK